MHRSFLTRPFAILLVLSSLGVWNLACSKISVYPTTSLVGTKCSRTSITAEGKTEYEFALWIPNKDGSLLWSATSDEPLRFVVTQGKPSTLITWRASEARVKSFKRFELSLFLASAGPNPIPISVPTYQDVSFGFPPIPIPHL